MIYLLRHGETQFNRERRLQGHVDSALTELGRRQIEAFAARLRALIGDVRGWRLVASPLGRAQRSAEIIAERLGLREIDLEPRLMEVSWGEWDGRLRAEMAAACPAFGASNWAFDAGAGESYGAACERLGEWLATLPPERERRVIAVSHGMAGRLLRGIYARASVEAVKAQDAPQDAFFRLANGEVARIDCGA
jgi:probable phosphoglycerate mutase